MDAPQKTPTCPRCGYDQSGVMNTWDAAGACSLDGVCSECGLDFRWADIFDPDRERLRGFFEHANTPLRFLGWAFTTLWWTARPWFFWRRVTLFIEPVVPRVLLWPVLLVVSLHVFAALIATADRSVELWTWRGGLTGWDPLAFVDCWAMPVAHYAWAGPWPGAPAGTIVLDPYGALPAFLAFAVATAAWPLLFLVLGQSLRAGRIRCVHVLRAVASSLACVAYLSLLGSANAAAWLAFRAEAALRGEAPNPADWVYRLWGWTATALTAPMLIWWPAWWWFAINRGFRLRHGWWVWGLLLVASLLAGMLTLVLAELCRAEWYLY